MSEEKQYAERDLMGMDCAGNHYCRHVSAMTREQLHSKSDIAAELGWRDMQIAGLKAQRDALAAENAALKLVLEPKQIPDEIQDLFNDTVKLDGDSDGYHEWSWVDNPDEVIIAVMNAMPKPETPATDAYLNSVRAEGVESFAHYQRVIADALPGHESQRSHCITASRAEDFAKQLRAGEPS